MKKIPLTFILFSCFLLGGISINSSAQEVLIDEIAAVVGDKIILRSEIEIQAISAKAQGYEGDNIECEVLDQVLLEKMFINQAIIDSVAVGAEEVEAELEGRIRYFIGLFNGDVSKLEEYYGKTVMEIKEEFRQDIEEQLLARRMQSQIMESVKVTPSEVKSFFNAIPTDSIPYFNAEIEIGQLVAYPKIPMDEKLKTRGQLLEIKRQVEAGESDFAQMAASYSEDPGSAANGGDLGWMERGQLVSEFEGAAFRLKNGEMSDIVETQYGFHLIKLVERRGEKINARHILMKPVTTDKQKELAKAKLDSVRNLILNTDLEFRDAVEQFSDDEATSKTGGYIINNQAGTVTFEMDQLDPSLYFVIDTLQKGELSKPIEFDKEDGSKGYRLLYIYDRTKPHLANLTDDYNKIQKVVENMKQQESMQEWLMKYIPKTYIHIVDEYSQCDNVQKWKALKE